MMPKKPSKKTVDILKAISERRSDALKRLAQK